MDHNSLRSLLNQSNVPHILWKPKFYCGVHNSLPFISIPNYTISKPCPYPLPWRSILVLSWSTRRSYTWSLLCMHLSSPRTCYMSRLSHSSWFYHEKSNWRGLQAMKNLIVQSAPLACYLVPLRPNYLQQHPILKQPQTPVICQRQRPSYTPKYNKIYVFIYILAFTLLDSKLEHKIFQTKWQ